MNGVAKRSSIFVCYKEQGMFGESVSVKGFIGRSRLIYSFVKRDTASVGLDSEFNGCFVLIGNVVIVGINYRIHIYPGVITAIVFHTDSFL